VDLSSRVGKLAIDSRRVFAYRMWYFREKKEHNR